MWPRREANQRPVVLFQHIAKCGGTSLVEHFGSLGPRGLCLGFACRTKQEVTDEARRLLSARGVKPAQIRAVYGHRVYHGLHELLPNPARYATLLRQPADRVISLFNHHAGIATSPDHPLHQRDRSILARAGQLMSFADWLENIYSGNHMVRFLYYAMEGELVDPLGAMTELHLAAAKRFIDACWYVGTTETSDEDFRVICEAVGLGAPRRRANVSQPFVDLSPTDPCRQRILEIDSLDQQLYEYALERRARQTCH